MRPSGRGRAGEDRGEGGTGSPEDQGSCQDVQHVIARGRRSADRGGSFQTSSPLQTPFHSHSLSHSIPMRVRFVRSERDAQPPVNSISLSALRGIYANTSGHRCGFDAMV